MPRAGPHSREDEHPELLHAVVVHDLRELLRFRQQLERRCELSPETANLILWFLHGERWERERKESEK